MSRRYVWLIVSCLLLCTNGVLLYVRKRQKPYLEQHHLTAVCEKYEEQRNLFLEYMSAVYKAKSRNLDKPFTGDALINLNNHQRNLLTEYSNVNKLQQECLLVKRLVAGVKHWLPIRDLNNPLQLTPQQIEYQIKLLTSSVISEQEHFDRLK